MDNFVNMADLIGQEPIKQRLSLIAQTFGSAENTAMPGHMLFEGPVGSGRLAFAQAFADSIRANWMVKDVRSIEIQGDLTAFLTNFKKRTVCVFEGTEQWKTPLLLRLTEAHQTGKLTITIGQGPAARDHVMDLHPFTAIFIINGSSRIPEGLREAATFKFKFQRYSTSEMERICLFHAERLGLKLSMDDVRSVVQSSSGLVGNIVRRLKDIASFMAASNSSANVEHALSALGIVTQRSNGSGDIEQLSGIEFERKVCGLLASMGFQTELTSTSGDGGIDIVAHLKQPIVGGRYLFQCKRFASGNLVSAPQLRDFFGALKADPTAIKGVFVTTSSFTGQARQFAQQVGIELIDSQILSELLDEYQS